MSLNDYFSKKPDFDIFPLLRSDLHEAAAIHSTRFSHGWSDGALQGMLVHDIVYGFAARQTNAAAGRRMMAGFVLARAVAGEAEILTICVDLRFARAGIGWRLMQAAVRHAREQGCEAMFLEVDEANAPAVNLYRRLGFTRIGERKAYYQGEGDAKSAALVMKLDLR